MAEVKTGVFIDSPVQGLSYRTSTQSGFTNERGEFNYLEGGVITFSVGDVFMPPVIAGSQITPLDLAGTNNLSDTTVVNIVRLLQSMDVDANPDNDILLDDAVHAALQTDTSVDFALEDSVTSLLQGALGANRKLVDSKYRHTTFGQITDRSA